ncbi:phospho-N-acetylmuramoyl-pentapeptide-transferase [Planctomicrobium sp. SH668]|uniref:phospho-N-acetylmuramoyl-pentapeptide- transferase n=1 Tax=Planctomicrobium sp. SH668 TaxID=3448126 RepID=UPI003F5BA785
MIPWLLHNMLPYADQMDIRVSGDTRVFLTARTALAAITAFLIAVLVGPYAIRWLRVHCGERIDSASETLNKLHAGKQKTPTMGGLFIMGSLLASVLLWGDLTAAYVQIATFLIISFTALGAIDDWIKLSTTKRGLKARQKLAVQFVLAMVTACWLYYVQKDKPNGLELMWPVGSYTVWLGAGLIPWAAFVIVSTSNGVNLTDGLDGLATGCAVFCGTAFVALTYLAGHHTLANYLNIPFMAGSGELSIVVGALVGSMLGFLWFNCYPAQVFMGDTGSLPIGALLAFAALVTRQEALLVIIGGVFVIETLSVIMQISCYRLTGKRLIACSPLHNHFVFRGMHEIKIVTRFWIGSALLAILGMVSLKLQ